MSKKQAPITPAVVADQPRFGCDGFPVKVLVGEALLGRGYRRAGMYYRDDRPVAMGRDRFVRSFIREASK